MKPYEKLMNKQHTSLKHLYFLSMIRITRVTQLHVRAKELNTSFTSLRVTCNKDDQSIIIKRTIPCSRQKLAVKNAILGILRLSTKKESHES